MDRLIVCTGIALDYRSNESSLISRLRERRLLQSDPLGLGAHCDPSGALLDVRGQPRSDLHTLGTPRKGQLWESIAVPELRLQARDLAQRLLRSLPRRLQGLPPLVPPSPQAGGSGGRLPQQLAEQPDQERPDRQLQSEQVQASEEADREIENAFLGMFI